MTMIPAREAPDNIPAAAQEDLLKEYYRMQLYAKIRAARVVEDTKPAYYKFELNGAVIDVFDIARAMGLPNTLFMALKYFRIKGDKQKRINDLEKAKECINREIEHLRNS